LEAVFFWEKGKCKLNVKNPFPSFREGVHENQDTLHFMPVAVMSHSVGARAIFAELVA